MMYDGFAICYSLVVLLGMAICWFCANHDDYRG
jgi:hypothetical protein